MGPPGPRDEIEARVVDDVARFGWHGVSYFAEPERDDRVAHYYTVGLVTTHGQPEILVVGRAGDVAHGMARTAVEAFADGLELRDGLRTDAILEGYDVRFAALEPEAAGWLPLAGWYHGAAPWWAVQLLVPDREGRFPGEPGYDDDAWPQPCVTGPPPPGYY